MFTRMALMLGIIFSISVVFAPRLLAQEEDTAAPLVADTEPANAVVALAEMALPGADVTEPVATEPAAADTGAIEAVEATATEEPPITQALEPVQEKVPVSEWVWGEVVSVDKDNRQLVIKHLDYDTYEEVQTTLKLDDKTLLENVVDLSEINKGDHVTVDYKIEGGVNTSGLIVVDKKEAAETPAPAEAPDTTQ